MQKVFVLASCALLAFFIYWFNTPTTVEVSGEVPASSLPSEVTEEPSTIHSEPNPHPVVVKSRPIESPQKVELGDKPTVKFDDELIQDLKENAWISSADLNPSDVHYDKTLLQLAKRDKEQRNFTTRYRFQNGTYMGVFSSLNSKQDIPFLIQLIGVENPHHRKLAIQPQWMKWAELDSTETFQLDHFKSPFSDSDYPGAYHWSPAPFVSRFPETQDCKEILLIPTIQTGPDAKTLESMSGRAFCRKSEKVLTPLAQWVFRVESRR